METLVTGGAFFECPRWHRDGRLWVSDYWGHQVSAISLDGTLETVVDLPGPPSGLGWLPDGTLLVLSMMDRTLLRVADGKAEPYADLSAHSGPQCNDMVVDAHGRAYVSTIDFADWETMAPTNLVRVDPDGSVALAATGLSFPNGSVITPDGSTLIVAESWSPRLTAFDIGVDGSLGNRRVWADFGSPPVCTPDGIVLDASGAVWVADVSGNRAVRVGEGGEILAEVSAGDLQVIACALGGDDGRTLFLCVTSDFRLMPDEAARVRPSQILTCRVDVPGAFTTDGGKR